MKKIIALFICIFMILSSVTAFAYPEYWVTQGNEPTTYTITGVTAGTTSRTDLSTIYQFGLYEVEDGKISSMVQQSGIDYNDLTHLQPGGYIYMVLCRTTDNKDDNKITNVKIKSTEKSCRDIIADAKCELVSLRVKGAASSATKFVCAKIPITFVPSESYSPDDMYVYWGEMIIKYKDGSYLYPKINAAFAGYDLEDACVGHPTGTDYDVTLKEKAMRYVFNGTLDDEFEIHIEDENACFMIDATLMAPSDTIASMNNDEITEITDLYGSYSNMTFYNGRGVFKKLYNTTITIFAEGVGKYLYKYDNGVLTDLSDYYDVGEDAFIWETGSTVSLATYIVSEKSLASAGSTLESVATLTLNGSTTTTVSPSKSPVVPYVSVPNTGCAE